MVLQIAREFFLDENGSEIAEYALVLALFAIVAIIGVQSVAFVANNSVEADETGFANSMAVGN
jgi:Flp pilus assembly pilin Flp